MYPKLNTAIVLMCLACPAKADATLDAVREFGLLGTFSSDCSKQPKEGVLWSIYQSEPDGRITYFAASPKQITKSTVLWARMVADDKIRLRVAYEDGQETEAALERFGSSHRTLWSVNKTTGKKLVENGISIITGYAMPIVEKCR